MWFGFLVGVALGCQASSPPLEIVREVPLNSPVLDAPSPVPGPVDPTAFSDPRERPGATAKTATIDYPPLGLKLSLAYPEEGHLCVIVPESAQEPMDCMGLDPAALVDALPDGPGRPFGVAYARMGDWSYIVMVAPAGSGIESKEDIEEFIGGALKVAPEYTGPVPKLMPFGNEKTYELSVSKSVPMVKFRIDTPHPPDSPQYDVGTALNYAAFGGKTAIVSFLTSPKDFDKLMPYADATVQSLVLPPNAAAESFGKPRAELEKTNTKLIVSIFGPLIAIGALLFVWLAKAKKVEDEKLSTQKKARAKVAKGGAASPEADSKTLGSKEDSEGDGERASKEGDGEK